MAESDKTARRPVKRSRCAIYTRKSTDEGLEQAFNSLDAQREACAAFILSQKHEGWTVLPTLYDDGGYSGGTMERPALQRLLADIEAGQIDVVVVYKVDRLTRALSDFAKLVEVFDRLADGGNTLVVIEHNLDVIKRADWIIDLGPEGGDKGGTIIATGTPEQVSRVEKSFTGQYLKHVLK